MNYYLYSSKTNEFFPYSLKEMYQSTGQWPDSGIDVDEDTFALWKSENAPEGKIRGSNSKGEPEWVDLPELTKEQYIEKYTQIKLSLMNEAFSKITPLEDAVELDMATDEEKTSLTEWKKYRVYLNRVDTSTAPDIKWPEKPSS